MLTLMVYGCVNVLQDLVVTIVKQTVLVTMVEVVASFREVSCAHAHFVTRADNVNTILALVKYAQKRKLHSFTWLPTLSLSSRFSF